MAVRKRCRSSGCKASPRCDHAWWLDVMHRGRRYRMPVDDFAFARGATASVTSKQEAEKVWEPKFIAEIASGTDPRRAPRQEGGVAGKPTTIADLFKLYRERYVDVEPLKSRHTAKSQLRVLTSELGDLPVKALERPEAIEDFKARCSGGQSRPPIATWRDCATSATGRSDAICSARRRSIVAGFASRRRTSDVATDGSARPRSSSCSKPASC